MKTLRISLTAIAVIVSLSLFLSSCSEPSSTSTTSQTTLSTKDSRKNPSHGGKNDIQSVSVSVDNKTTEALTIRAMMGSSYQDLVVTGFGTSGYSIPLPMTSAVINGQTFIQGVAANVTLPNTHVVNAKWDLDGSGNIIITVEIEDGSFVGSPSSSH